MKKNTLLPDKIFTVEYAGYHDFNLDGKYGESILNETHNPNAAALALEMERRYNKYTDLLDSFSRFNEIIDQIESRCMAVDGPVTPTLQEASEEELAELWQELQFIKVNVATNPELLQK